MRLLVSEIIKLEGLDAGAYKLVHYPPVSYRYVSGDGWRSFGFAY